MSQPTALSHDEKQLLLRDGDVVCIGRGSAKPQSSPKIRSFIQGIIAVLLAGFICSQWIMKVEVEPDTEEDNPWAIVDGIRDGFEDIAPSTKLEWHECYNKFLCARLTVPMDYHRPLEASSDNPKVDIALLMLPGLNHSLTKNWSTSPLLINPGGPGGPGTSAAAAFGPRLRSVVGYDQDIIGFDPRGIQYTTPLADCFSFPGPSGETSEDDIHRGVFHRLAWATMGKEVGMVNSSDAALQKLDHRARGVSKLCGEKDKLYGNDSILRHVDTPNVARDMLSIIDAWDAWVEEEKAKKQTVVNCGVQHDKPDNGAVDPLDTKGKLVYWGFSYGSLLGATFAAMFPDRVGRVILDGVVDADHYVAPIWSESIQDTDKVLSMFYRHCVMVASKCSFFRPFDTETTLAARLHEVEARLRNNPIVTVDKYSNAPSVFSYSDLRLLLFSIMYSPVQLFPILSDILNYIYEEDTEFFSRGWGAYLDYKPFCTNDSLGPIERAGEAQLAIMCSDKRYPLNETVHNLNHLFKKLSKHSSFADVWVSVMMGCDGWEIEAEDPPMRWDDHPVHKPKPIKTFFPVLFLSNSADPVTPLAAGVLMARKFVDAGLVEQESGGHCSISTVSQCTIQKVREYFHEGKVPPHPSKLEDAEWTRCSADEWPWQPYQEQQWLDQQFAAADADVDVTELYATAERMSAWQGMQKESLGWEWWGRDREMMKRLRGMLD